MLSKVKLDDFYLYSIDNGTFKLDGGAMFGVVPKTLWSKQIKSDDLNRITMAMRSLLVVSKRTKKIYLIDTGVGTKFNEKLTKIYGLDLATNNLDSSLSAHGFSKNDITDIIFTHLHFDHCGGISKLNKNGEPELEFKNANIWVTKSHWETANTPNAREKASFFRENLEPIRDSGRLKLIDEGHEYETGLGHIIVDGHTLGQQLPLITSGSTSILFAADLLPTFAHIPTPWVMGYDMYPTSTLLEKQSILTDCYKKNILLYMQHDAQNEVISVKPKEKYYSLANTITLNDL
ncbi:MAG: MBL fold metallo-hydrolase [Balneolales bacterium]